MKPSNKEIGLATKRNASELLQVGRIPVRVIDDGSLNGHQLGAIEATLPARTTQTPPHVHKRYTVTFLVTSGTIEFKVNQGVLRASEGDYMGVPLGAPYTFSNPFDAPASFHCAFTPSGLVDYFRELDQLTKQPGGLKMDQWIKVMARFGIDAVDL
jgi:quercetin dioxygenase-like cupin family protein